MAKAATVLSHDINPEPRRVQALLALQELCSRVVGQTLPFELVLQHQPRVPEDLQKRIAFWSFPLDEKQVLDYASAMMGASDHDIASVSSYDVCEMVQTG